MHCFSMCICLFLLFCKNINNACMHFGSLKTCLVRFVLWSNSMQTSLVARSRGNLPSRFIKFGLQRRRRSARMAMASSAWLYQKRACTYANIKPFWHLIEITNSIECHTQHFLSPLPIWHQVEVSTSSKRRLQGATLFVELERWRVPIIFSQFLQPRFETKSGKAFWGRDF